MGYKFLHHPASTYVSFSPSIQSHHLRGPGAFQKALFYHWDVWTLPSRKNFFKTQLNLMSSVKLSPTSSARFSLFIYSTNILFIYVLI